jgi:hypothetical protein
VFNEKVERRNAENETRKGLGEMKSGAVGLKLLCSEACVEFSSLDGRPSHLLNYLLQLPHEVSALYGVPSEAFY